MQRLEWLTYDWRTQVAHRYAPAPASSLGVVLIDEESLNRLNEGFPGSPRWPLPYAYHGLLVKELTAQGAATVAFDVFFRDRDVERVPNFDLPPGTNDVSSQVFFARQLQKSKNVVLGVGLNSDRRELALPRDLLRTNALALGLGTRAGTDDGVLRFLPAYRDDARTGQRIWSLGLVLAAQKLGLNLSNAVVKADRIELPGVRGVGRTIPLVESNYFLINWDISLRQGDWPKHLAHEPFAKVVSMGQQRWVGRPQEQSQWRDRLVLVGATGTGSNVSDRGPVPIGGISFNFLAHLNVANSLLQDRFIRQPTTAESEVWLCLLSIATALAGWKLRPMLGALVVAGLSGAYITYTVAIFVNHRVLFPIVLPVGGAVLTTFLLMTVCRALEQAERQRLEGAFAKVVSPRIMEMLVESGQSVPPPQRREMTVMFADIRGFTQFCDVAYALDTKGNKAAALGRPEEEAAREVFGTVNRYLSLIVEEVKAHDGTVDKYMGDCVMAFWGAPAADEQHATKAVRCAMRIMERLAELNRKSASDSHSSERSAEAAGKGNQEPTQPSGQLEVGIGINTGPMTVGFMGSEAQLSNYTVFGHAVNVASRIEGLAIGSQTLVTEETREAVLKQGSEYEFEFVAQGPVALKGLGRPASAYAVRRREPKEVSLAAPARG